MPVPLIGIVDDDPFVRESMSRLIEAAGYRTRQFESGEAFLSGGCHQELACLILDMPLAGLSGLDLQLRLTEMNVSIPIIFVAGFNDELWTRAIEQGAITVLGKPFNTLALLSAIQSILEFSKD